MISFIHASDKLDIFYSQDPTLSRFKTSLQNPPISYSFVGSSSQWDSPFYLHESHPRKQGSVTMLKLSTLSLSDFKSVLAWGMKTAATDQTDLYAHSSSICLLSSHLLLSTLVEKALTLIMDLSSALLIQSLCVSVYVCLFGTGVYKGLFLCY